MEYSVTGNWDDPQIEPIEASGKEVGAGPGTDAGKEPPKHTPRPANAPARSRIPEFIEH
ncbi:hypothetical protein D3C85_1721080 [compost metagenome]